MTNLKDVLSFMWFILSMLTWVPYTTVFSYVKNVTSGKIIGDFEFHMFLFSKVIIIVHWIIFILCYIF